MSTPATPPDYGEPWKFSRGEPAIESRDEDEVLTGIDYTMDDVKIQRAIACVNACAGMVDPAAEIKAMREAIQAADALLEENAYSPNDLVRSQLAPFLP